MKIPLKRITKLRHKYAPRASRQRLRLTEKRIRVLERQRIRKGRTFEAVYRSYSRKRVNASAARIAKSYGVSFEQAKKVRKAAVKSDLTYRELIPLGKPVLPVPALGVPLEGTNYLEFCRMIMDIRGAISKGKAPKDFFVSISFGETEYEGPISGLVLQDFKDEGHEQFSEDTNDYWVLDTGLVSGVYVPDVSLTAVIATDRTEVVSGESEVKNV